MTVTLTADDGTVLELDDCAAGYLVQSVDIGGPEVRAVTDPRTMADGVVDRTRYVGARAITIGLRLAEDPTTRLALLDALAPFLHPGQRSWLSIAREPEAAPRMYRVRADDWSQPWERPMDLAMSVSWRTTGTPFSVSADLHAVTLVPSTAAGSGRAYNEALISGTTYGRQYDRTYPAAATSVAPVINAGSAPAEWTATVWGPINGFTLQNLTTGDQLAFPTLNVAGGTNVVIDSATHTVLAGGDPGSSRYSYIDFAHSTWFRLAPGLNRMTVTSTTSSAPSQTTVAWRDTYMT